MAKYEEHEGAARWRRWALSLGLSLLAHAALLVWWMSDASISRPVPTPPSMAVEIVAAPPAPAPEPRARSTETQTPRVQTPKTPLPSVRIAAIPSEDQPAIRIAEQAPPSEPVASRPQPAPPPPPPAAAAIKAPETRAATASPVDPRARASWEAMVIAALDKAKRYPPSARFARQQGTAFVSFAVGRSGNISDARLVRSSGVHDLDEEAMALLRRVRLPPPPGRTEEGIPVADRIALLVPIDFSLSGQ